MADHSATSASSSTRRRVLFLNDLGFHYGAGIAQARQIQSLLELGWEVGALAWEPGHLGLDQMLTRPSEADTWLGMLRASRPHHPGRRDPETVIAGLLTDIGRFNPDVVIAGNLHSARWPLQLLVAIRQLGIRVVAYMHDGYLFTGRCPYPGDCELFLTGCDHRCPTATEYPSLEPEQIAPEWRLRRDIFAPAAGIEVAANSHWTRDQFRRAIPRHHSCETVYLGADERVFCPGDKAAARAALQIPDDRPVVLCAAVNFQEKRKGTAHLERVIQALKEDVRFIAIGHNTNRFPDLLGMGYHTDQSHLARIYQAADLYLGTAREEAFGQTILEAQLCARPVVAFDVGGVREIVEHQRTGRLIPLDDDTTMIQQVRELLADQSALTELGAAGRELNASRFSIAAQAAGWEQYLQRVPASP